MDIIYISQLRIDTYIGVHEWEQQQRQTVVIDLELGSDVAHTAATDDLSTTADYAAISARLLNMIENQHFRLLETLAEQIAQVLQEEFGVPWLQLRLGKPGAVPQADDVGVIIERGEQS
ncbi:dihydroneopterin aldolase [Halieaceae bacterium IMCC14734]|uniref:7,8-dihydroneopterin aldolase n=1 Tax=Candidatus Litorirhabdus singularis TaxID=2518993 RepID=A0ABT3TM06_9GAMM|nr:dihydroneopterin aldolase [Candidatus Litorirhabdus singularis]MCX2983366.1 dihydroneopterin aldolase [Candidatus Litorirhabdus singularis]